MNKLLGKCINDKILNIVELIAIDSSSFHIEFYVEYIYKFISS